MTSAMSTGSARRPVGLLPAERGQRLLGVAQARHRGVRHAGGDDVDADAVGGELAGHAASESDDAELARHVGGGARPAAVGRPGREIDDRARPARGHHAPRRLLRADEGGLEVGVEHRVPRLLGELEKGGAGEDAGVVHQHVDRAERTLGVAHEAPRLLGLGDVGVECRGPPAERRDLGGRGLGGRLVVEIVERHVGARLGKPDGDGAADAALGARHEHDLSAAPLVGVHGGQDVPHPTRRPPTSGSGLVRT